MSVSWFKKCWTSPDSKVHGANMGPPGSCRPQMGPMLAPWALLLGSFHFRFLHLGTLLLTEFNESNTGTRTWKSNYIHVKQWGVMTQNVLTSTGFNQTAVEVRAWISNYILRKTVKQWLWLRMHALFHLSHVGKRTPSDLMFRLLDT